MATDSTVSRDSAHDIPAAVSGHLPSSGSVLGFIVEILNLAEGREQLRCPTTRRWFKGGEVRPASKKRIIRDVATATKEDFGDGDLSADPPGLGLISVTLSWDALRSVTSSLACTMNSSNRLFATPTVIVRGAIEAGLHGLASMPEDGLSASTSSRDKSSLLRKWMRSLAPWISRDKLADTLPCSPNTLDAWLDKGALPKSASIDKLARFFARHLEKDERRLAIELRLRRGVIRLKRRLRSWSRATRTH